MTILIFFPAPAPTRFVTRPGICFFLYGVGAVASPLRASGDVDDEPAAILDSSDARDHPRSNPFLQVIVSAHVSSAQGLPPLASPS